MNWLLDGLKIVNNMLKTLLALSGAMLLAAPSLHAQGARSYGGGGSRGSAHEEAYAGGARGYAGGRGYAYRGGYYGRGGRYGRY